MEAVENEQLNNNSNGNEKSIKKNYIYNLIAKLFALLIPILITPFLARKLEADGNGTLSFISSIVSYFILAANIGIETYGQRIISIHRNEKEVLKRIVIEIFLLRLFLTVILAISYYLIFVFILTENTLLYSLFGLTLIFTAVDFTWYFQGIEDFKILAIVNIISKLIYIPLIFVLVKTKNDLWIACLLTAMTTFLPFVLCVPKLMYNFRSIKISDKIRPFRHFKECMVYFIPTIAVQIYTVLDKTMIGLLVPGTYTEIVDGVEVIKKISYLENGYYEQAEKIVKLPLLLITSLNIIMRSRISYYYSTGKIEEIKETIKKSMSFSMCFSIPICLGMIAIAKMFVPIYLGDGYDKCVTLMYILSPILVIISISNLLGTHYYTPFDMQRTSNKFLITGSIVNLILNLILIRMYASIGAAIASIVAELVVTFLYVLNARKFVKPISFLITSIKYLIAGVLMFIPVFILNLKLDATIINLCLIIALGIFIYFITLLILRDKFLINTIKSVFSKVRNKIKRG